MDSLITKQIAGFLKENKGLAETELVNKLYRLIKDVKYKNNTELLEFYKPVGLSAIIDKELLKFKDHEKRKEERISTGFKSLDADMGGFHLGELVIIGARPGMGKTQLALHMCFHMLEANIPTAYFTFDIGSSLIFKRLLGMVSDLSQQEIEHVSDKTIDLVLSKNMDEMKKWPLFIEETLFRFNEFVIISEKLIKEKGVKVIFVDYLQLLGGNYGGYNREQELAYISRELKKLARRNNVLVVCTSQLSRQVESRAGGSKRPCLSDLRETGAIEQDSDKVLLLYRPEYYGIEFNENNEPTKNMMEVIVAKNRNSTMCNTTILFKNNTFTKITENEELKNRLLNYRNNF